MSGTVGAKSAQDKSSSGAAKRSAVPPRSKNGSGPAGVLALQRAAGNQAVGELLADPGGSSGARFTGIQIHSGPDAAARAHALGAAAFAMGREVYLGAGIDPATELGQRVLTHELTHVVQQERGRAGMPVSSTATLEGEARGISGIGAQGDSTATGAASPGAAQMLTEEELLREWRSLHPRKKIASLPGAPGQIPVVDEEADRAERQAFKDWREERLKKEGEEAAAKVRPWNETDEARKRENEAEEANPEGFTDINGQPSQGPITLVPSEVFHPVVSASGQIPRRPHRRNPAAEGKAAWEARTPLHKKAEAAKPPPLSSFVSEHDRAVLEAAQMTDILPGGRLGRHTAEFITGEDVLERKLSRRELTRDISKDILLDVLPLLIPEGGLIGGAGGETPILERGLEESAPFVEGEAGGLGRVTETVTDLPPAQDMGEVLQGNQTPGAFPEEAPLVPPEAKAEIPHPDVEPGPPLEQPLETQKLRAQELHPELEGGPKDPNLSGAADEQVPGLEPSPQAAPPKPKKQFTAKEQIEREQRSMTRLQKKGIEPTRNRPVGKPNTSDVFPHEQTHGLFKRGAVPEKVAAKFRATIKPDMPDPAFPTEKIGADFEIDHIVAEDRARREIKDLALLDRENQLKVLNREDNFQALSKSANASKGNKSFQEWTRNEELGLDVDKTWRQGRIQKENELLEDMKKQVEKLLKEQMSKKLPRSVGERAVEL
jgi:hypothetical protein